MKYLVCSITLFLFSITSIKAQNKKVSLEEIWGGNFRSEYIDALHSMHDGEHYSVLDYNANTKWNELPIIYIFLLYQTNACIYIVICKFKKIFSFRKQKKN